MPRLQRTPASQFDPPKRSTASADGDTASRDASLKSHTPQVGSVEQAVGKEPCCCRAVEEGRAHRKEAWDEESEVSTTASVVSALDREQIALVLDWDDTLFPATWLLEDAGMVGDVTLQEQLNRMIESDQKARAQFIQKRIALFVEKVEELLSDACSSAMVFIVTLAKQGWVENSIKNFMPELQKYLDLGLIGIHYSEKYAVQATHLPSSASATKSAEEKFVDEWSQVKAEAIYEALTEENGRAPSREWQSIISIGDSDFERYGTIKASKRYSEGIEGCIDKSETEADSSVSAPRKMWTKTLKLLDDPTAEELIAQLSAIQRWLPSLLQKQDNMNLEIQSSEEDNSLRKLHKRITGLDEALSWEELACLSKLE